MTHTRLYFPRTLLPWTWTFSPINPFRIFNNGGTLQEPVLNLVRETDKQILLTHTSGLTLPDRCIGYNGPRPIVDVEGHVMRDFDFVVPYP